MHNVIYKAEQGLKIKKVKLREFKERDFALRLKANYGQ